MSATTYPHRQRPATAHARSARAAPRPQPEPTSDHGYMIKVVAADLLVTVMVAIIAPLGWAILLVAFAILLATTAAVLHASLRLLNESGDEGR